MDFRIFYLVTFQPSQLFCYIASRNIKLDVQRKQHLFYSVLEISMLYWTWEISSRCHSHFFSLFLSYCFLVFFFFIFRCTLRYYFHFILHHSSLVLTQTQSSFGKEGISFPQAKFNLSRCYSWLNVLILSHVSPRLFGTHP